jgi:hypothetical protein
MKTVEIVPNQFISCVIGTMRTGSLSDLQLLYGDCRNDSQQVYQLFYRNDVNRFPARLSAVI